MKQLILCLIDWIDQLHASGQAAAALRALAVETLKRVDSPDPDQRKFDAQAIAEATNTNRIWDFDQAKQWLSRANVPKFVDARTQALCGFFREKGHHEVVVPVKTETSGRVRAEWFLEVRPLPSASEEPINPAPSSSDAATPTVESAATAEGLVYEYTPPTQLRLGPLGWLLLGRQGNTPTKSARGVIWAGVFVLSGLVLLLMLFLLSAMGHLQRPLTTGDLVNVVMLLIFGTLTWRYWVRPLVWLGEDRIIPAPNLLPALTEDPCQLEMPKDGERRYIRLVRYSGVCPVCAGQIELRYGAGHESRRLFGCCIEAPQDHVFSFDRVTRKGAARKEQGLRLPTY